MTISSPPMSPSSPPMSPILLGSPGSPRRIESRAMRRKLMAQKRSSLTEEFGDDDDMAEEWKRLSGTQLQLQRQLSAIMKVVDIMQCVEDDDESAIGDEKENENENSNGELLTESIEITEEENDIGEGSQQQKKPGISPKHVTFARGFFNLIKPQETLDSQRKRQMEILQAQLQQIDPELYQELDGQQIMQNLMIEKKKQDLLEREKQLKELKGKKNQDVGRRKRETN